MAQNLISATLTTADATAIIESLSIVKTKMPFLSTLQKTDVSSLFKIGNAYLPFIDKIYQVVVTHPEILPAIFDKDEFLRDYELFNTMRPIFNQINELAESVQKTFTAVGSDTLVSALEVYAAVKQNKDKVPGLSVMNDEMAVFFKRARVKSDTTAVK
jgi:hypothetical protein